MSLNISGFIKKILPSFDKSDLESDLEISLKSISLVQETYTNIEQVLKVTKLHAPKTKDLVKEFYKELDVSKYKVKLASSKNMASDTLTLFKNIKINGDYLLKEISDTVNDVIVSHALSAYKANILRSVAHYYFMNRYALDFANYIYIQEAQETDIELSKDYSLNKKQVEFIEKNLWVYARLVSIYGMDHELFKSKILLIPEITLDKNNIEEIVASIDTDKVDLFNNLPANFIGSPIYAVRLIFAQWEADRYRSLKDKKKLLELRFLHLKLLQEQKQTDVNVEKEIEYLQKRITDIDYTLSKIEESVE